MTEAAPLADHAVWVIAFVAGLFFGMGVGLSIGLAALKRRARDHKRRHTDAAEKEKSHGVP